MTDMIDILIDQNGFPPEMIPAVERRWEDIKKDLISNLSDNDKALLPSFFTEIANMADDFKNRGIPGFKKTDVEATCKKVGVEDVETFCLILFNWKKTFDPMDMAFIAEAQRRGVKIPEREILAAVLSRLIASG
jgi:hypothetical protein